MSLDTSASQFGLQHSIPLLGEYLNGNAFSGGAPVVVPAAFQRGLEWDSATFRSLLDTLLPWDDDNASAHKWYQAGKKYMTGEPSWGSDISAADVCYLHDVSVQARPQYPGAPKVVELIDGQQRTFCTRALALWLLTAICKRSEDYELSSEIYACLAIKTGNSRATPRAAMDFENGDTAFQQLCAHFLMTETDRSNPANRKQALMAYESQMTYPKGQRTINPSPQMGLYRTITNQMDQTLADLLENYKGTEDRYWLEAIALRLIYGTCLTLTVLDHNYNAARHFMQKNNTGKDLSEFALIRSSLMTGAKTKEEETKIKVGLDTIKNKIAGAAHKSADNPTSLNHAASLIGHALNIHHHGPAFKSSNGQTIARLDMMHLNKAAPMVPLILMDQALDMLPAYLNTYLKGPGTSAFFGQGLSPFIDDLRNIGIKSVFFPIMYAWKNHPGDMERLIHGLTVMAIRLRASDCARSQKGEVPGRRGASLNHAISSTFNKLAKSSAVTTFPFVETLLKECISCGYYSSDLEKNFTSNAANMQFKPNDGLLKVLKRLILHNETKLYALPPDQLNLEHVLPQNPCGKDVYKEAGVSGRVSDAAWKQIISRLGNYVLLSAKANQEISNREFSFKKKEYARIGHGPSVRNLASLESFTVKDVERRSQDEAVALQDILSSFYPSPF